MKILTEQELAKKIGYNRATLAKWRRENKITPVSIRPVGGGLNQYYYDEEQVIRQLRACGKIKKNHP